ncbi:MAG: CheY-like chemotaxis protein [Thermoproteota archaeon]
MKILQTEDIHCVVSDINMPIMSGTEFIEEARKQELMMEIVTLGVFDFLNKSDLSGLKEGFKRKVKSERTEEDVVTEFSQLMDQLSDKGGDQ